MSSFGPFLFNMAVSRVRFAGALNIWGVYGLLIVGNFYEPGSEVSQA